jgi:5'-methylthioadenosine phosphorylase
MVVIEGPRFSTRAESQHYAAQGWSLINMTGHPEAVLAREMRQCYVSIALVTDLDAGVEAGSGVSQEEVFALFAANLERLRTMLTDTVATLPDPDGCSCSSWAEGLELTYDVPGIGS